MPNQSVIIGGKEIPLVTPKSDLDIASRLDGGKYHVPSELLGDLGRVWRYTERGTSIGGVFLTANDIVWNGTHFVAVGANGSGSTLVRRSTTGENGSWTASGFTPGMGSVQGIAFDASGANGLIIASGGAVSYTTDRGLNWTAKNSGQAKSFNGVAYGAGGWLIVNATDSTYTRLTSTGGSYSQLSLPAGGVSVKIRFANNLFMACRVGRLVSVSATGLSGSWTNYTVTPFGATEMVMDVAFGNGTWVAIGSAGHIAYSKDNGATWQASELDEINGNSAIIFAGDRFINGYNQNAYRISTDGKLWETNAAQGGARAMAFNGSKAVGVGTASYLTVSP